jgi:hypothetical protein
VRNANTCVCVEREFYFLFRVKKKKKTKKKNVMTRHGAPPWYAFVVVGRRNLFYRYGACSTTFGVTCTIFFFHVNARRTELLPGSSDIQATHSTAIGPNDGP